jgi:uncharacterized membrane protein YbhN (UPF0104 family)
MTPRRARILRWAAGLLLLAALVVVFNPAAILGRLASADPWRAIPALGGLVAVHLIAAAAWRRLAERVGGFPIDARSAVRMYYAAQAWGAVTPANIGADVYRVAAFDAPEGRGGLAAAVLVQRLASTGALVLLAVIGSLVVPIPGAAAFGFLLAIGSGIMAVAAALLWRRRDAAGRAIAAGLARLGVRWHVIRRPGQAPSIARDGLGLSIVFHATSIALAFVLVTAVEPSTGANPVPILGALAIARLSLAVPLSPNGIGLQEGALSLLFVQLGMAPEVAVAAGLLNRVALIATAGVGWLVLTTGSGPAARTRSSRASTTAET